LTEGNDGYFDPKILSSIFDYDSVTGLLFWKPRPDNMFNSMRSCRAWNTRWGGKSALNVKNKHGYLYGTLFGNPVYAHRVCWAIINQEWPEKSIDHINGNTSDNSLINLRQVTASQNQMNRMHQKNSKTQIKGVWFRKDIGKYESSIRSYGKKIHLGTFLYLSDAQSAYVKAASDLHNGYTPIKEVTE